MLSCAAQQQEVVILYGDMSIRPFEYVRKTPNFDQANWPECASATRVSSQSSVLLDQLPSIRTQHTAYISELSRVNNEVRVVFSLRVPPPRSFIGLSHLSICCTELVFLLSTLLYSYCNVYERCTTRIRSHISAS